MCIYIAEPEVFAMARTASLFSDVWRSWIFSRLSHTCGQGWLKPFRSDQRYGRGPNIDPFGDYSIPSLAGVMMSSETDCALPISA